MGVKNYKETKVYKLSFEQSMDVFETAKLFPGDEIYSLTDQVRRSSRSVCANVGEAYRKKMYPANLVSKVSDSDTENTETNVWIDFSLACKYITHEKHTQMSLRNEEIGRLLHHMINNPEKH